MGAVSTLRGAISRIHRSDFTAVSNRLDQIIRTGGGLPQDSRAVGAAIVDVPGYHGPTELRAISAKGTDVLGQNAPVAHAPTPEVRTLSAAQHPRRGRAR